MLQTSLNSPCMCVGNSGLLTDNQATAMGIHRSSAICCVGSWLAGHQVTAGKAVIGARRIGAGSVFQFNVEMRAEWRVDLLVPLRP